MGVTTGSAMLADGSSRRFDTYAVEMDWDGRGRQLLAYGLGDATLLGMELLAGPELRIAVVPGGAVEIAKRP